MTRRYLGGLISATPPVLGKDAYYAQNVLHLTGNGTNGAQNNTFLDSSSNNFSVTRNGNATQGSFSPFSKEEGKWGNSFPGSSSYLYTTLTGGLGSGNFTVEFFVLFNSVSAIQVLFDGRPATTSGAYPTIYLNGSQKLVYGANSADRITGTTTISAGVWYYVALQRIGTDTKLYLNAVQEGSTYSSDSTNYAQVTNRPVIGGNGYTLGNEPLLGHVSNLRISDTSRTISVPTAPYTSDGNTRLLTCQSNRFKDNSSNAFTLTPNGNVAVTPFSPFANSAAYSAATNGGSGYFDGSGDYLTVADNTALEPLASNFVIEWWYFPTSFASNALQVSKVSNAIAINGFLSYVNTSGVLKFNACTAGSSWDIANDQGTLALTLGVWNHCAIVRSGSTWRTYVNGASSVTFTSSATIQDTANTLAIGAASDGTAPALGYFSNVRFVKGSTIPYDPSQTTLTVPTAPLTSITNTQLLLNFTNAAIYDQTGMCDLETVGNAQISTSVKKYGTGSMSFDGTDDILNIANGPQFAFGTCDFTIEFWVYGALSGNTDKFFLEGRNGIGTMHITTGASGTGSTDGALRYVGSSTITSGATVVLDSTWHHCAVVRSSGNITLYVDGTSRGTGTDTTNYTTVTGTMQIGGRPSNNNCFNGYIDDLRISRYARCTGNFTPPSIALPTSVQPDSGTGVWSISSKATQV